MPLEGAPLPSGCALLTSRPPRRRPPPWSALPTAILSNVKAVGAGVFEYKIDFGPGYRLYFGRDGDRLVILLAGGTKKRQQQDIENAKANWKDYRKRKT